MMQVSIRLYFSSNNNKKTQKKEGVDSSKYLINSSVVCLKSVTINDDYVPIFINPHQARYIYQHI